MVDCQRVVQFHVIHGDLDMDLLIRVEAVWRESDCLAARIMPLWNTDKFFSSSNNWKTCKLK